MIRILLGVFFVLHGLVHLLYFGQSARYFELQPGMIWPHGSWVFSKFLGNATIRNLAGILLILAAIGFIAGGIGLFFQQTWWRAMVVSTTIFSSMIYLLFWDASFQHLDNKGGVGFSSTWRSWLGCSYSDGTVCRIEPSRPWIGASCLPSSGDIWDASFK